MQYAACIGLHCAMMQNVSYSVIFFFLENYVYFLMWQTLCDVNIWIFSKEILFRNNNNNNNHSFQVPRHITLRQNLNWKVSVFESVENQCNGISNGNFQHFSFEWMKKLCLFMIILCHLNHCTIFSVKGREYTI